MVELFKAPPSRLIYVFRINDPAHNGAVKIGEATYNGELWPNQLTHDCKELRKAAHARIKQYTQTAAIKYDLVWATPAFSLENGIKFNDKEIHQVLINSGFKRRQFNIDGKATEWIECDPLQVMKAIGAIKRGRKMLNSDEIGLTQRPIDFRDEQKSAIQMAVDIFRKGGKRALWNAKMRFGKTLCALEVVKRKQFKRTLILTHRPVVNASWFEDFNKIFFDTAGRWIYGSKAADISFDYVEIHANKAEPNSYVYFTSMQDLRGSSKAGGKYDKNNELYATEWDFIIVDEAHEGTQTELGQSVLQELTKKKTKVLFLSGTPFNIQNEFTDEETFTWDYTMEQEAKRQWEIDHPGDFNPYGTLPTMNIYTYDLGRLLSQKQFADKEVAFNFREFFRTDDNGILVHYDYVKRFLDLLTTEDKDSLYPFANRRFRSIFRHTLWIVPGVKEAAALEEMLLNHDNFGARGVKIVNVAGDMDVTEDDEERRYNNALTKLREAIGDNPFASETITLSCGRLTTGVSVPEWVGVIMLSGTFNTAAATYMQTIFRVQTPWEYGGLMKDNCYVFDFAPDRTLTVLAEVARVNTKPGKADTEQKERLAEFLNYCSVIAEPGSQMKRIDANRLMERVKKVYIDRVVRSGFEDSGLYNDELLKLSDIDVDEFNRIGNAIGRTKTQKAANEVPVNQQGLDNEQYKKAEEAKKKSPKDRTPEDLAAIEEAKKRKEMRRNAESVLRSISIRMPLLIYGADIDDSKQEITIDNFESIVDDSSWDEFMPTCTYERFNADGKKVTTRAPLSKADFRKLKKYYDPDIFIAAAKRIRQMVRNADEMFPEQRIARIAEIFNTFKNPDKETVLTPWSVVNMHMTDTLGGYTFFNEEISETIEEPRFVDRGDVTAEVFTPDSHLLEINSKSGLYPLYLAYSIYRSRLRDAMFSPETLEEHQAFWDATVAENIFVICKTPMAESITRRTLLGFRKGIANTRYFEDLVNQIKNNPEIFIAKVAKGKSFWKANNNDDMKFKAIVGNPPYQEVSLNNNKAEAIYPYFYDIAERISGINALISPARFLFNAGLTPKVWNQKMLSDEHICVVRYFHDSADVFPNTNINGGVAIILRNASVNYTPIGMFIPNSTLRGIAQKFSGKSSNLDSIGYGGRSDLKFNEVFLSTFPNTREHILAHLQVEHPEITELAPNEEYELKSSSFSRTAYAFASEQPENLSNYYKILGIENGQRIWKWVIKKYLSPRYPETNNIGKFKIFISKADGAAGQIGKPIPARIVGKPELGEPNSSSTASFISLGCFDSREEAENLMKYVQTKFARVLLGVLKVTQDITPAKWAYVPMQDFTTNSDIDWSKSIEEIDAQLYAKYNLSDEEIAFIESMIKPM